MSAQLQHFAEAAMSFCSWAETTPSEPEAGALTALEHLSMLYQLALALPELFGEQEPPEITRDEWQQIYVRFGSMPFNYYDLCFYPQALEAKPVVSDIADDLRSEESRLGKEGVR